MRGQFITPGAWRLLNMVLFVCVLACHPIQNKLYIPLLFAIAGLFFTIVDAAKEQNWTATAILACCFVYLAALCIQSAVNGRKSAEKETRKGKKQRRTGN